MSVAEYLEYEHSQDRTRVEVRTRGNGAPRVLEAPDDVLRLESIGFELRVADLYD